jgi:MFS family permease
VATGTDTGAIERGPSLRAVAVAFFSLGLFFGTWAVGAADIEHALGVGHGGFGALLAVALVGTVTTSTLTGALVERFGTEAVLACGCLAFAVAAAAVGLGGGRSFTLACATLAVYACSGVVDVSMNVAAAAELAERPGSLVRFHALFNGGATVGAACAAVATRAADDWRLGFALPAAAMVVAAAACWISGVPSAPPGEHHGLLHSVRVVRREHLVGLAVVFACSAMVEGGIDTWGVLVLRNQLEVTVAAGATAYVLGQALATTSRTFLGPVAGRFGAARGVAVGSGLAAAGLVLVGVAPTLGAAIGLAVAATGVSVCWPMLLAYASQGRDRPAGVVSGVTAMGYVGFVVGPVVIGTFAELVGLRAAVLVLALVAAGVAIAPTRVTPTRRADVAAS